jgi:hypothetical protein
VGKKRQRLPKSSAFFFGIFAGGSRAAGCLAIDGGRARALNMSIRHADFVRKGLLQICDDPDKSTLVVSAATKLSNRGSIAPMWERACTQAQIPAFPAPDCRGIPAKTGMKLPMRPSRPRVASDVVGN